MKNWLESLNNCLHAQVPGLPAAQPDEATLSALQKGVDRPLPAPFLDFLRCLPGGLEVGFHWELPDCVGGQVADLNQMKNMLLVWKQPCPAGTRQWWRPQWVPLLDSGSGNFLCLDLEGSFGNPAGSLLQFSHGKAERPVVFPDFQSWLRWLALALQQGMGRVFREEQKLDIALNRKASNLYKELFPGYPLKCAAEVVGLGLLDQALQAVRKQGLKLGPNCGPLPEGLSREGLESTLKTGFVREDGSDGECVRVILLCQPWAVYAHLKATPEGALCESLVWLPENAADSIRSALLIHAQGDAAGASRRLSEAAFSCFQAGRSGEALAVLDRALHLNLANALAARSRVALQNKQVKVDPLRLRPLLKHLAG